MFMVTIDEEKCEGCGECTEACPAGILVLEGGKARVTDPTACMGCETCVTVCPTGAPSVREV
ncbi:4Fe-4S binding protein [Ammonifex thiophilus]|uniref:4Fe-4S dicluster domain-containing protein n=1 Tax=Ammonifex thiophilus TaxID=444093 RepID=A0A3D8P778_9THEO|nr:4Fe-4S binding protein [Ammonifex thiophilus]RDV84557.1 4Fe-4S dicluster domain-containing protein [Ammonifex thiophilus]